MQLGRFFCWPSSSFSFRSPWFRFPTQPQPWSGVTSAGSAIVAATEVVGAIVIVVDKMFKYVNLLVFLLLMTHTAKCHLSTLIHLSPPVWPLLPIFCLVTGRLSDQCLLGHGVLHLLPPLVLSPAPLLPLSRLWFERCFLLSLLLLLLPLPLQSLLSLVPGLIVFPSCLNLPLVTTPLLMAWNNLTSWSDYCERNGNKMELFRLRRRGTSVGIFSSL